MPPFDYEAAFRAHSADDREASGATLEAIDLAVVEHLPGWSVVWAMTGGGCSRLVHPPRHRRCQG